MTWLLDYVKVTDCTFTAAVLCIFFNPLFWNVVSSASLSHPRDLLLYELFLGLMPAQAAMVLAWF